MKRSLKELNKYSVQVIDGEKGKVKNFLFDEDTWIIRYLDIDMGNFFVEKRVLIPREQLDTPEWEDQNFPIKLTMKRIDASPDLEHDLPVSRRYEQDLAQNYDVVPYWPTDMALYPNRESIFTSNKIIRIPKNMNKEKNVDTSLRSFSEVHGYSIKSTDDNFGHLSDIIIDDLDWQIVYVVLDTKNIVPWSKQIILPIEFVEEINFQNQEIRIDLTKEVIKNAPEYDSSKVVDAGVENALYEFYK
ncbi:PRC-barrel domain-containing protein [Draconibacterium halophilum]|uniref:PRC-barrel domain-containing protein n=1 Tax=Draconibacterium halophilum TaxID=2706887 RepID=A0A6C0RFQ7_9BACT|nr:PRC-barrel domain-containing protein [Draconibacterium halophilum]QIA08979.1 hypothetical protein G0Q07_15210 [Draconibacterium halophilum]